MADWFFKVFIWYGLILQIRELGGFGDPRGSSPSSGEEDIVFRFQQGCSYGSGDLQRSKGGLKSEYLREMCLNSTNVAANKVTNSSFDFKHVIGKITHRKGVRRPKQQFKANMLITDNDASDEEDLWNGFLTNNQNGALIQVPDDDNADDGNDTSTENRGTPKIMWKPAKSSRYLIRNGKKILVRNDVRDGQTYYAHMNKAIQEKGGFRTILMKLAEQSGKEDLETELHKEDAFVQPDEVRPVFEGTMTYVNMLG